MANAVLSTNTLSLFRSGVIYTLVDPNTQLVRYVGKTFSLQKRISSYRTAKEGKEGSAKRKWLISLKENGQFPILDIIDDCDEIDWREKERAYIRLYKSFGADLLNRTLGGEEGCLNYIRSNSERLQISEKMKLHVKTNEHNKNVSEALKAKWKNDSEYRAIMAKKSGDKFRNLTPEQKEKSLKKRRFLCQKKSKVNLCLFYKIAMLNKQGLNKLQISHKLNVKYDVVKKCFNKYKNTPI